MAETEGEGGEPGVGESASRKASPGTNKDKKKPNSYGMIKASARKRMTLA